VPQFMNQFFFDPLPEENAVRLDAVELIRETVG